MRLGYKIFRAICVTLLSMAVGVPVFLYIFMSIPDVQNRLKSIAEKELSRLLDTEVTIGHVALQLFNQASLSDIAIKDAYGRNALTVDKLAAGIDLKKFLASDSIIITYAELNGANLKVYRDSAGAPLNIANIIEALAPKDKNKPPTKFDFRVNYITLRGLTASYDILSAPATPGRFNPAHISVSDLEMRAELERIKNDDFTFAIRRFNFDEQSGLSITDMTGEWHITSTGSTMRNFRLRLPDTSLYLGDLSLSYSSWATMADDIKNGPLALSIREGSYINPSNLSAFEPRLSELDYRISLDTEIEGTLAGLNVERLDIAFPDNMLTANLKGSVAGLSEGIDNLTFDLPGLRIGGRGSAIHSIIAPFASVAPRAADILRHIGDFSIEADINGSRKAASFDGNITTSQGSIAADVDVVLPGHGAVFATKGNISTDRFDLAGLLAEVKNLGSVALNADFDITAGRPYPTGSFIGQIDYVDFKGYRYHNIAVDVEAVNDILTGRVDIHDPNATLNAEGHLNYSKTAPGTEFYIDARDINLAALNLVNKFPDRALSFRSDCSINGPDINHIDGWLKVTDLSFRNADGEGYWLNRFEMDAFSPSETEPRRIVIDSDIVEGYIKGDYNVGTLPAAVKSIIAHFYPALIDPDSIKPITALPDNDFSFNFTIKDNEEIDRMLNLPVKIVDPVILTGFISQPTNSMELSVNAPFLQQKNKLIEGSSINIELDGPSDRSSLYLTTTMPTKRGPVMMTLDSRGDVDRIDTDIDWIISTNRQFNGALSFSTAFERDEGSDDNPGGLLTRVDINPGKAVFNDSVWTVHPSVITIEGKKITVDGFIVSHKMQHLAINGVASPDEADAMTLSLRDIDLDYIFETLNIPNVMFGGNATGDFYASSLFSKEPVLYTPDLRVKGLSYNNCVMGDGRIQSAWHPDTRAITIDAAIAQANGETSIINGSIKPLDEELDFRFDAHRANVGFLKPFMSAFTSDVEGYASGKAHLYGTFKLIDMTGDIYAEDLKLKLDFTNTYYTTSDSVHITPGKIQFENVKLYDLQGNSALLSGYVTHECFKKPRFSFNVTDARNLLVYDVPETTEQRWYGKIYGNGSANVTGVPGEVDINVDMTTMPNSTFTFVLSDAEVADDYTFITFRDRDRALKDSLLNADPRAAKIQRIREMAAATGEDEGSVYKMNIAVNVTPSADVNLIMDPVGGDRIKANGQGTLRMTYDSAGDELKMFGTYTLSQGSYNFTLQDIFIKDFTIKPGSSITFHGDPYAALLDIKATYAVNANLSDLDESFLQDKDLNRTNVPVHALLMVTGDMRQPDIDFDLEFPTLTQDIYRKVKSIVSTEEMMNRQIIYLLALNRFYTPDYMTSTTKGNELVSVASSTISSQLSSILGGLSDKWSIAPNFRSDRGDFSDVEVDVALSSHLLNNRLLLNGNFGYRDKALNNNSFIGDFDIEYLLNRSGSIRLKAYNRYNDQNYYVKSALTTQGVGVVFKRDFDNMFSFIRPLLRRKSENNAADSTAIPTDSIPIPNTENR